MKKQETKGGLTAMIHILAYRAARLACKARYSWLMMIRTWKNYEKTVDHTGRFTCGDIGGRFWPSNTSWFGEYFRENAQRDAIAALQARTKDGPRDLPYDVFRHWHPRLVGGTHFHLGRTGSRSSGPASSKPADGSRPGRSNGGTALGVFSQYHRLRGRKVRIQESYHNSLC